MENVDSTGVRNENSNYLLQNLSDTGSAGIDRNNGRSSVDLTSGTLVPNKDGTNYGTPPDNTDDTESWTRLSLEVNKFGDEVYQEALQRGLSPEEAERAKTRALRELSNRVLLSESTREAASLLPQKAYKYINRFLPRINYLKPGVKEWAIGSAKKPYLNFGVPEMAYRGDDGSIQSGDMVF